MLPENLPVARKKLLSLTGSATSLCGYECTVAGLSNSCSVFYNLYSPFEFNIAYIQHMQ